MELPQPKKGGCYARQSYHKQNARATAVIAEWSRSGTADKSGSETQEEKQSSTGRDAQTAAREAETQEAQAAVKAEVERAHRSNGAAALQEGGLAALIPKPPGPQEAPFVVALETQFLVVALRLLLGWNEKRMAHELARRGLAQISHTSVGRIFRRYHLPTRTYHAKARSDGVSKIRYEKKRPNQQWHIDCAETNLQDGSTVILVALIDDHSRYCLCCESVKQHLALVTLSC